MKRLVLSFILAVMVHVVFFNIKTDWRHKISPAPIAASPVTLSLSYKTVKKHTPQPEQKPEKPIKKAVPQKKPPVPKKKAIAPLPEKQKIVVKKTEPIKKLKAAEVLPPPEIPEPSIKEPVDTPPLTIEDDFPLAENTDEPQEANEPENSDRLITESVSSTAPVISPAEVKEAVPVYLENPKPLYPRIARKRGYEGTAILNVFVGKQGYVKDITVFKSTGHRSLDRAALSCLKKWLFEPGQSNGRKIEMWVKVPVRFRLE